ncbi:MAG: manganese efflux pump MntP family protein [Desulfobacterales bacterium]|nr:manganese efflux pump MntP family protein [Desulfobacterales bacterium]
MGFLNIFAIAVALAMDAFAVAIASGVRLKRVSFRQFFRLAWHFGLFQALMPIIGWSAGLTVRDTIERFGHWVAFGLLVYVGVNMIREAFKLQEDARRHKDPTRGLTLVMLSVATSIDALAVGLTISMLRVSIWTPALIIGVVAGVFTVIGLYLGKSVGSAERLSPIAEVLGGVILLGIAVKIVIEHRALQNLFS